MIISFTDKNFKGLQNNASLVVKNDTFKLVKRPIELNDLSFTCEAFTENIQPTFLVVKNDIGNYVYGCLAGIPQLNENNQTEVLGTDLKSMLSSDIILQVKTHISVNDYINFIFDEWKKQVYQPFICELIFKENTGIIEFTDLIPSIEKEDVYNALEEIQSYLRFYNLFLDTKLDLINKKVQFIVGKSMQRLQNIKLWEFGVRNYGKWVADVNECQGYFDNDGTLIAGHKWILTSDNNITLDESKRDIFPTKKKIIVDTSSLQDANRAALETLLDSLFNENIELPAVNLNPDFETKFVVYVNYGEEKYKDLPCGELRYDSNGLTMFQIGYRYTNINFI